MTLRRARFFGVLPLPLETRHALRLELARVCADGASRVVEHARRVMVRYVRREIRELDGASRAAFFEALDVVCVVFARAASRG